LQRLHDKNEGSYGRYGIEIGRVSSNSVMSSIVIQERPRTITARVSVIIPVRNGGGQLTNLLGKIYSQKKIEHIEVVIVDSESTDNTVRIAGEFGAKVISILQRDFNHGGTRNLGAAEANGDFLVFTVQDAVPVSSYWLYNMICPFIAYPELAALSARQFIKPEADLFSIWENTNITPYDYDCIWSLPEHLRKTEWKDTDTSVKGKLMHFDTVSSCIRRSVFKELRFSPLMFGEDMDYGKKLLDHGKSIAFLSSTGVYHWHERDAGYILKRYYTGAKITSYIQNMKQLYPFRKHNVDVKVLTANILGMYDLIRISLDELKGSSSQLLSTVKSFVNYLRANMESPHEKIESILKTGEISSDHSLDLLLEKIEGNNARDMVFTYDFRHNVLLPGFMESFEQFSGHLCNNSDSLQGRESDIVSAVYKIFARTAGIALGAYYLEAESLQKLTPELKRTDGLLGEGVCYFYGERDVI